MKLNKKIKSLLNFINKYNKIIVAYSGGVDSATLLFLCKYLNKDVLAVTALSETYPKNDLELAKRFTKENNIKHLIIETNELKNNKFTKNTLTRCYYCKSELFKKLNKLKNKLCYDIIFDGTNYTDVKNDIRPGVKAAVQYKIVHPYVETKITKEDIRKIAKKFGLPFWDKPSSACLSSRIPFGIKISKKILTKVYKAEQVIKNFWDGFFRVRHHNDIARIELEKKDIKKFLTTVDIEKLISKLKHLGYKFVTLDLEGYIPAGRRYLKR